MVTLFDIARDERDSKILPLPADKYFRTMILSSMLGQQFNPYKVQELWDSYESAKSDLLFESKRKERTEAEARDTLQRTPRPPDQVVAPRPLRKFKGV